MKNQPASFRSEERKQEERGTHLYLFRYGSTSYFYCSHDLDIVVEGGPVAKMSDPQTFAASAIMHTRPDESIDKLPGAVSVTLPANDQALKTYLLSTSPTLIEVFIWRVSSAAMPGPLEYDDDTRIIFVGQVEAITPSDGIIAVVCSPSTQREDAVIPNYYYQRECNKVLYSQHSGGCGVNKSLFTVSLTISNLDRTNGYIDFSALTTINVGSPSRSVTITSETFHGGVVEDADGNQISILLCQLLTGPTRVRLWLSWIPESLESGDAVDVSCGCLLIKRVCHALFQNLPNFGATPYIPTNNPAIDGINA